MANATGNLRLNILSDSFVYYEARISHSGVTEVLCLLG